MPVDIVAIRKRGVDVEVPFYGEKITVTYDPVKVASPAFREEYNKRRKELQAAIGDWISSTREANEDGETQRIDDLDLSNHIWKMRGELVAMLIKDWDITSGSEPLAVSAEIFSDGTVPPELAEDIIEAVWSDVRELGNPKSSNGTKPG